MAANHESKKLFSIELESKQRRDDLSEQSAAALIKSMVETVQENASIEITIRREMLPAKRSNLSMFVVTLPPGITPDQQAEADYWLNEMASLFRYADKEER